ncbi:MAG TPA: 2-amino-4-hydroxy-6-hydroxymethyldihydropteridine diphosphokinase [Stellaceae bacterium]|jgi:2-amino-4-hydroxy-6-hydroxymethyldihydropteridine diphosphokinase|nr:2-amino-4-hydroxy-6-hydroxymethyldihydropteridine diphosphokinase [Stellaceae bacterium]
MILVGIGSNLAASDFASPQDTAAAAVAVMPSLGIEIRRRSSWCFTEPVPPSDQPWYVNAVAAVATDLSPPALLAALLRVETRFGRQRGARNAARTLDLDLLDYDGFQCDTPDLVLPHPRLHERRFILAPLAEIAPDWRHSRLRSTAAELLSRLPPGQAVRAIGDHDPPIG